MMPSAPTPNACAKIARHLDIAGYGEAADYVRSEWMAKQVGALMGADLCDHNQQVDLSDPSTVHLNMLRGRIAKLTDEQVRHLYPELFTSPNGGDKVLTNRRAYQVGFSAGKAEGFREGREAGAVDDCPAHAAGPLMVHMVPSTFEDLEDLPDEPGVLLRGDAEAVKAAAKLFGQEVEIRALPKGAA